MMYKDIKNKYSLSEQHTKLPDWTKYTQTDTNNLKEASLIAKSNLVGRVGIMFLSCGTGAWRIREAMNHVSNLLELTCTVSFGIRTIEYTCFSKNDSCTHVLSNPNVSVNTTKLSNLQHFVSKFENYISLNMNHINDKLDMIENDQMLYNTFFSIISAGIACGSFVFLLGGGIIEAICSFFGASVGQLVRKFMIERKLTLSLWIITSVFFACISYGVLLYLLKFFFGADIQHQSGYIGAVLFIIPGFPFITSCLDISKLYIRSGLERLTYSILIVTIATLSACMAAVLLNFSPKEFVPLQLSPINLLVMRLLCSFLGVYGFSITFNSRQSMAVVAGIVGAISNTLRLEVIDITNISLSSGALLGTLLAGILASLLDKNHNYPRITLTVPSSVIMVPGSYIYKAVFFISNYQLSTGFLWLTKAVLILSCLPIGLLIARIITDEEFRHCV